MIRRPPRSTPCPARFPYTSLLQSSLHIDDNAGGLPRGIDISGCDRINYITYTEKFNALTSAQQLTVKQTLPYVRTGAPEPQDGKGYWTQDRSYSAAGGGTVRRVFRPL